MLRAPGLLALIAASALAASLAGCGNEEADPTVPKSPTGPEQALAAQRAPSHQLRRVHDAYTRARTLPAVRDQLGISKSAARFELGLARKLGATRLRRATRAAPGLRDIKRDRLAATMADTNGELRAAQMLAMTVAELRARAQRGRELRSSCELESA